MLDFLESLPNIADELYSLWERIIGLFSDVDFTVLYDWLPNDIMSAITAVIAVMIILALIGLVKKVILFLG